MILPRMSYWSAPRTNLLMILIPLALSAFTHIWNPAGFPYVYIDELSNTMQRTMIFLQGGGIRDESFSYDNPFFGELFLAGIFKIIGYPNFLIPSAATGDVHSIEMMYLIPRVLMGLLAVIDTFLIYKISENSYNRRIAFMASILFAVMPITWLVRRILLDSILLPFLLSSILFAVYVIASRNKYRTCIVLLSGICLGFAIFTKLSAFPMILLIAFIIYRNSKSIKLLGLWFIPVILLPVMWPFHALYIGELDLWLKGMNNQSHRQELTRKANLEQQPLIDSIKTFFKIDPILFILGTAGLIFAAIRKNVLLLLWVIPYLVFLYYIGFVQYFYLIEIVSPLCIAAAILINESLSSVAKKVHGKITKYYSGIVLPEVNNQIKYILNSLPAVIPFVFVSVIVILGLISTTQMVTTNQNTSTFNAIAYVAKYLSKHNNTASFDYKKNLTIISDIRYLWILQHLVYKDYNYKRFWDGSPVKTEKVLWILDDTFKRWVETDGDGYGKQIVGAMQLIYNNTVPISEFSGKQTITENRVPSKIQIRTNI